MRWRGGAGEWVAMKSVHGIERLSRCDRNRTIKGTQGSRATVTGHRHRAAVSDFPRPNDVGHEASQGVDPRTGFGPSETVRSRRHHTRGARRRVGGLAARWHVIGTIPPPPLNERFEKHAR